MLAPVESVEEFGRGISMQLDFTIEARNNRRFAENFKDDRDVIFPALIDGLCSARVLTMEFVDGTKILNFRQTPADPKRLAAIGFRVMLKMVFEDGFVHADLHPGNIFITRDDRVAILDLGLVGELDGAHRARVREVLRGVGAGRRQDDGALDVGAVAAAARSATTPASRRRSSGSSVAITASASARCRCRWCSST